MKILEPIGHRTRIRPPLLWIFALAFIAVAWIRAYTELHSWAYTHWRFDYDFGLYKRGLVGEFISLLNWSPNASDILILANANIALIFLLAAVVLVKPRIYAHQWQGWMAFAATVLLCASTVQHLVASLGRLNNVALLLATLALAAVCSRSMVRGLIIVTVVSGLTIGVHEASLFLISPLLLAAIIFQHRFNRSFFMLSTGVVVSALTALAVITLASPVIQEQEYLAHLKQIYPHIHRAAVETRFVPLSQSLKMSADFFWSMDTLIQHSIYMFTTAPVYMLLLSGILKIEESDLRTEKMSTALILILCHAPLLLYPLGIDHFRWLSACVINLSVILLMAYRIPGNAEKILEHFQSNRKLAYLSIVFAILTGPVEAFFSYRWSEQLFSAL